MLAIYIYRRTIVCNGLTVTLPAEELAELGVARQLKSKALVRLQQVGLIRVENSVGRTAQVTLTWSRSGSATNGKARG